MPERQRGIGTGPPVAYGPRCSPPEGQTYAQYATLNGKTILYDAGWRRDWVIPVLSNPTSYSFKCIYFTPTSQAESFMFDVMPKIVEGIVAVGGVVTGLGVTGILGEIGTILGTAGAGAGAAGATGAITSNSIIGPILSGVSNVSSLVNSVIGPITDAISGISKVVQTINDQIIQPIVGPINTIFNTYSGLIQEFHGDLKEGLRGLVNVPSQIADSLTTISNAFNTSVQQLDLFNRQTISDVLLPGVGKTVQQPLEYIGKQFQAFGDIKPASAYVPFSDKLTNEAPNDSLTNASETIKNFIDHLSWPWSDIVHGIWDGVYSIDYFLNYLHALNRKYDLEINKELTPELLDPRTVIEAERRSILHNDEAITELAEQGLDKSRHDVLYAVSQYLFDPRAAVDLLARKIIGQDEFNSIMDSNNLSSGQAISMQGLMEFIFSPGEVAQLFNRSIITQDVYNTLMDSARVGQNAKDMIKQLSLKPLSGRDSVIMDGRLAVKADNFMPESLGTNLPDSYKTLYKANQTEETQGELDWLAHWRVPSNDWWVEAVWRGLRTKEEAYEAFKANNTPQELYEDQFGVMEELPPVWLVPDVLGTGVWPKDKAVATFLKLGFSEENANVLADYGLSKLNAGSKAAADTLHGLSMTNAKDLYDSQAISKDEYLAILKDHGVGETAANLTVELTDIQNQVKERNDYVTYVIDTVKAGQVTEENALADLATKGYTEAQRVAAQLKMTRAKTLGQKIPTKAEAKDFLIDGLITDNQFYQVMTLLGYSHDWIVVYYEYYTGKPVPPGFGAE